MLYPLFIFPTEFELFIEAIYSIIRYYYSKEFVYNTKIFEKKVAGKFASLFSQAEKFDLKKFLNDLFTESSEYIYIFTNGWINKEKQNW